MLSPESGQELYVKLAEDAFDNKDYFRCLSFALKIKPPIPAEIKYLIAHSSYRAGMGLAAKDNFPDAREHFARVKSFSSNVPLLRVCESRLELLTGDYRTIELEEKNCPICTRNPALHPSEDLCVDELKPDVDEIYCIGAYRSGYDADRSNKYSVMLREIKKPERMELLIAAGKLLAHFVVYHLGDIIREKVDFIIPVPTSSSRYLYRGYSVPEELAKIVAMRTSIPYFPNLLEMERETNDLRGLSPSERRSELDGAFSITQPDMIAGLTIMIVDDIVTYGTTQREIGRLLHGFGASEVVGVVLAHTEPS